MRPSVIFHGICRLFFLDHCRRARLSSGEATSKFVGPRSAEPARRLRVIASPDSRSTHCQRRTPEPTYAPVPPGDTIHPPSALDLRIYQEE